MQVNQSYQFPGIRDTIKHLSPVLAALAIAGGASTTSALEKFTYDNDPRGVQVFILAGQSNMVDHGKAEEGHKDEKGAIGSLRHQVVNDPKNYGHLVDKDGNWIVRDDVKVWWRDSDITEPRAVLKGKGYRIGGFGWHQGWNDRVDAAASAEYEKNLADFIRDLRKEFGNPKLPFSITTTSMAPPPEPTAVELAQLAVADAKKHPEFKGNVMTTNARSFWREASVSPSNFGYHWNHNGESTFLNDKAMGQQMVDLLTAPQ